MYNPDFYEVEISKLNNEKINTIFGTIGVEPIVPKKGRIKPISESAKTELLKNAVIDCPNQWRQEYEKLIVDYHDVISKDPFDPEVDGRHQPQDTHEGPGSFPLKAIQSAISARKDAAQVH
jgi:hypothetical protein